MLTTILLTTAIWVGGGALFAHASLTNPHAGPDVAATSRETAAGIRRGEPAALVALALFVAAWPVLFVGLHVAKLRS